MAEALKLVAGRDTRVAHEEIDKAMAQFVTAAKSLMVIEDEVDRLFEQAETARAILDEQGIPVGLRLGETLTAAHSRWIGKNPGSRPSSLQ